MNRRLVLRWGLFLSVCMLLVELTCPVPANADGGLILSDPQLWAMIDEGQQIAVVKLRQDNSAQVDLFISMSDRTGVSHQVVFFLPLGFDAHDFGVVEQTSLDFDKALTAEYEKLLNGQVQREAAYKDAVRMSLLLGTFLTNGVWSWVVISPFLAGGCAGRMQAPVATFATAGSAISIYDMNTETNLEALIETTGLDPSVKDTLARLQGQQIAVVRLQTQPKEPSGKQMVENSGQPGIHLTWVTGLASTSDDITYTYPLGTGKAWASPIEVTRVYVVAPPDMDFSIQYPQLGADMSGPGGSPFSRIYWRIDQAKSPAFSIDNAYGSFGRIWRATYIKSNSDQDLLITRLPELSQATRAAIRRVRFQDAVKGFTWVFSLLAGAAVWLLSWRVVMNGQLGIGYSLRQARFWKDAFGWSILYPLLSLGVLLFMVLVAMVLETVSYSMHNAGLRIADWLFIGNRVFIVYGLIVLVPLIIVTVGLLNAFFFSRSQSPKLEVPRRRLFGAYMLVVLMANTIYLPLALGYAALVGAW